MAKSSRRTCRTERVGRLLQRELAKRLSRLAPALPAMTTVSWVDVAPDMSCAKVHVTVLGDADIQKQIAMQLKDQAAMLRFEIAKAVQLRNTPELRFMLDSSVLQAQHLHQLIDDVNHTRSIVS